MSTIRPAPRRDHYEEEYWRYVASGELRLQRCGCCGRCRYPPAPACGECGGTDAEWTPLSGRGHIVAWTVFHRTYFPSLPAPYTVVSVATEEGPLLVGNLVGGVDVPTIGASVTAFFEEVTFDNGTGGRICQWRQSCIKQAAFKGEQK